MNIRNIFLYTIGLIIGMLLSLAGNAAPMAAQSLPEHMAEVCYGSNITVRGSMDNLMRAELVHEKQGKFVLSKSFTDWGPCLFDGEIHSPRLHTAQPVVYKTMCDTMSSIGGMRVSYAFAAGIQEANTVYLLYAVEYNPCTEVGGSLFVTDSDNWHEACLVQPLDVVYDPTGRSGIGMGTGPVQFHCDSGASLQ